MPGPRAKMTPVRLADELLLVNLSLVEPRNTRSHLGIRAAVGGADVLETWFSGGPPPADLKRTSASTTIIPSNRCSRAWPSPARSSPGPRPPRETPPWLPWIRSACSPR